jgi:transposase
VTDVTPGHGPFELESERLGGLPIVDHFFDRVGFDERLKRYLPRNDRRLRLAPGAVCGVVVRNIVVRHRPLYAIAEWAAAYDPALVGLKPGDAAALNDDRVGRSLDRLFDADRASLLTEMVLAAVEAFGIDCSELHNDSTTVTVTGSAYQQAEPPVRGGKHVPVVTFGHNKDFRPDLRQLVYDLTVSADGAVPVALRIADGNTNDDVTHVPTWDGLVAMLGRSDFLYVADSKLCSKDAMGHIAAHGGRFVTVVPHGRREDRFFKDWIQHHAPAWTEALRLPGARNDDPDRIWRTFESPVPSSDGYRVIWVHSSGKAVRDAAARSAAIERALADIEALEARLTAPRSRLRSKVAVEEAARSALREASASGFVIFTVTDETVASYAQESRGRPGAGTRYRRREKMVFHVRATLNAEAVAYDTRCDGLFPLITNDSGITPGEVLGAYRYQPNLERRHHVLKGPQLVVARLPREPPPHRGPAHLPFLRSARRGAHRTRDPDLDARAWTFRNRPLSRAPPLLRPLSGARARDLRRHPAPSPEERRRDPPGLRTQAQSAATAGARPTSRPNHRLHVAQDTLNGGRYRSREVRNVRSVAIPWGFPRELAVAGPTVGGPATS